MSSSDSEYGLAYADSTDYEDADDKVELRQQEKNRLAGFKIRDSDSKPPFPLTSTGSSSTSILRSNTSSTTDSHRVHFPTKPLNISHKKTASSSSSVSLNSEGEAPKGVSRTNSAKFAHALGLSQTPPTASGRLGAPPPRSGRSSFGSSSGKSGSEYSRSSARISGGPGAGKLESAMETLLEDGGSDRDRDRPGLPKSKSTGHERSFGSSAGSAEGMGIEGVEKSERGDTGDTGSAVGRSNTVQGPYSPESRAVKLPTRSRTSPTAAIGERKVVKKSKVCVRCEKRIEDGRWVKVDGGGILCERCWKNMYLPKVSVNRASDWFILLLTGGDFYPSVPPMQPPNRKASCFLCGWSTQREIPQRMLQLPYLPRMSLLLRFTHRFNLFALRTQKPFPDKSFYVFDGKPLCAYHYHEANDSLCAAALCGQPIEGPCAVSHAGDRYHPEHFLCEFPGYPACKQRLEEYFEVDGRMLCERHAQPRRGSQDEDDEEWVVSARAQKRVTRFIDLGDLR